MKGLVIGYRARLAALRRLTPASPIAALDRRSLRLRRSERRERRAVRAKSRTRACWFPVLRSAPRAILTGLSRGMGVVPRVVPSLHPYRTEHRVGANDAGACWVQQQRLVRSAAHVRAIDGCVAEASGPCSRSSPRTARPASCGEPPPRKRPRSRNRRVHRPFRILARPLTGRVCPRSRRSTLPQTRPVVTEALPFTDNREPRRRTRRTLSRGLAVDKRRQRIQGGAFHAAGARGCGRRPRAVHGHIEVEERAVR